MADNPKAKEFNGGSSVLGTSVSSILVSGSLSRVHGMGESSYTNASIPRDRTGSNHSIRFPGSSRMEDKKMSTSHDTQNSLMCSETGHPTESIELKPSNYPIQWPVISRSKSSYSIHVLNQHGANNKNSISTAKAPTQGFLQDVEMNGFAGMWNHPITRCYFLMYVIWTKQANLYVCLPS